MITLYEIAQPTPPTNIPQRNLRVVAPVAAVGVGVPAVYYAGGLDYYNNKVVPTVNNAIDSTNKTIKAANEKLNGNLSDSTPTMPNVEPVKDPLSFDKSKLGELTLRGVTQSITDYLNAGADFTNKYIANPLINKFNKATGSNVGFLRTNNDLGNELLNHYNVAKPETMAEKAYTGTLEGLSSVATGSGLLKGITAAGSKVPAGIKTLLSPGDTLRGKVGNYVLTGGLSGGLSAYE